jgi:hypothetical protein
MSNDVIDGGIKPPVPKEGKKGGKPGLIICYTMDEPVSVQLLDRSYRQTRFTKLLSGEEERKVRKALESGATAIDFLGHRMRVLFYVLDIDEGHDQLIVDIIRFNKKTLVELKQNLIDEGWDARDFGISSNTEYLEPEQILSWGSIWHKLIDLYRYDKSGALRKLFRQNFETPLTFQTLGVNQFLIREKELSELTERIRERRRRDKQNDRDKKSGE